MDNTRLIITETFRFASEDERKAYMQAKIDQWIMRQLEREGYADETR